MTCQMENHLKNLNAALRCSLQMDGLELEPAQQRRAGPARHRPQQRAAAARAGVPGGHGAALPRHRGALRPLGAQLPGARDQLDAAGAVRAGPDEPRRPHPRCVCGVCVCGQTLSRPFRTCTCSCCEIEPKSTDIFCYSVFPW